MGGIFSRESWGTVLLNNIDQVATWGNNEKTKVMIISPDIEQERKFVKEKLKTNNKTNRIRFEYLQVPDKTGSIQDEAKFMEEFKEKNPTVVVLAYKHHTKGDLKNTLNNCPPGYAPLGSVAKILHSKGHLSKIIANGTNYLFLETCNMWHLDSCILTSLVPVTGAGVREQLEKAVDNGNLINSKDSRVLIVTGGHGGTEKNGRVTPAGAHSCFTKLEYLEYDFYKEDCDLVGIQPENDICIYDGSNEVIGLGPGIAKPIPGPKAKSKNALPTALMKDGRFNSIEFDVVNVAHYNTSQANINELVHYVEAFRPTHIVIGWCFSSRGDLAMALRRFGIFPKMILEHEMRIITKDPKAKLSDQQVEVLKKASLDVNGLRQFKDFHLSGGHGSGKTSLGVEITKTWLAEFIYDGKFVNILVFAKANMLQTPSKLLKKLEEDLKEIASHYGTDVQSKFQVLKDRDGFTVEQLAAEIKKEISKLDQSGGDKQKDVATIVLTDEVSTAVDKDTKERNFAKMPDMGPNVHSIYLHSPISNTRSADRSKFSLDLPPCKPGVVYSTHLLTRYRNNSHILNFLQFFTEKNKSFPADFLLSPNETPGASLPPALPGSPHPVLWLDCNWNWKKMDEAVSEKMIEKLVAEEGVQQINDDEISRLIVRRRKVNDDELNSCSSGECEGIEAEIVVVVGGLAATMIEALSRARRQLVIITGTDSFAREFYMKAEKEKKLLRKEIKKIPDCLISK